MELRTLDFTPDSQAIAAAGKGKVIHIWDVVTGQEILTLEGHAAQINAPRVLARRVAARLVQP